MLCNNLIASNLNKTLSINRIGDFIRQNFLTALHLYREINQYLVVEKYVRLNLTSNQRSLLAQLRIGILPIRVETGRFNNMKLQDRLCQQCNLQQVEDEIHFLFYCELYAEERNNFINEMSIIHPTFTRYNDIEKVTFCCQEQPRKFSKYIKLIYDKRNCTMYI